MDAQLLKFILETFKIDVTKTSFQPISQGYINDTYLVSQNDQPKYILQRINSKIFKDVHGLHNNIENALKNLTADNYQSIVLSTTKNNKTYFTQNDSFWRVLNFIKDSTAYNFTSNSTIAFEAGRIIGRFHTLLQNETIDDYIDTVPNLNYLPFRITEFEDALKTAPKDLKITAEADIRFANKHFLKFKAFYDADLPHRICHNDTKLNNILFSKTTHNGLCLIDLDTIMKGYFHYDFGDAVRTVVSEANEDEKDLIKISFNTYLFESFIDGINSNGAFLNKQEIEYLPLACALMPFMHGLRALTDYLNGNVYYSVSYKNQNLDRCRSLFHFAKLTLQKQDIITSIIKNKF